MKTWLSIAMATIPAMLSISTTGCGVDRFEPDAYSVTFQGQGYEELAGRTIRVALVREDGRSAYFEALVEEDGSYRVTFEDRLQDGFSYRVDLYVDLDGEIGCTADDYAWTLEFTELLPVPTSVDIADFVLNAFFDRDFDYAACASFDPEGA